jgi:hypothetical protein
MAPRIACAWAGAGLGRLPDALAMSKHCWRSVGGRAPTRRGSAGGGQSVPSGPTRCIAASGPCGAAGGWTRRRVQGKGRGGLWSAPWRSPGRRGPGGARRSALSRPRTVSSAKRAAVMGGRSPGPSLGARPMPAPARAIRRRTAPRAPAARSPLGIRAWHTLSEPETAAPVPGWGASRARPPTPPALASTACPCSSTDSGERRPEPRGSRRPPWAPPWLRHPATARGHGPCTTS